MDAVILTGGERERCVNGEWHVPKADLVAGLRVMLEKKELRIEKRLAGSEALMKELAGFGARGSGVHDDLAIALALAGWRLGGGDLGDAEFGALGADVGCWMVLCARRR